MFINGPDPEWYARRQDRWMQMIQMVMQASERKKRREDEEFRRSVEILADNPDLAAGAYGNHVVDRWGRKRPEVEALVGGLRNRHQMAAEMQEAQGLHASMTAQEAMADQQRIAEIQAASQFPAQFGPTMPVPAIGPLQGLPTNIPNPAHLAPMAQHQMMYQPPPDARAFMKMTPAQQAALAAANKMPDFKLPYDRFSEKTRALAATSVGDPERFGVGVDVESGLSPNANTLEATARQEDRQLHEEEMQRRREAATSNANIQRHNLKMEALAAQGKVVPVVKGGKIAGWAPGPNAGGGDDDMLEAMEEQAELFIDQNFADTNDYEMEGVDVGVNPDGSFSTGTPTVTKTSTTPALRAWQIDRDKYLDGLRDVPAEKKEQVFKQWKSMNPPPNPAYLTKSAKARIAAQATDIANLINAQNKAKGQPPVPVEEIAKDLTAKYLKLRSGFSKPHTMQSGVGGRVYGLNIPKMEMPPQDETSALQKMVDASLFR